MLVTLWLAAPTPATAHDFPIVLVTAAEASSAEALRGFRLAVDESPDVSHPPGPDAGDHLGGVDVTIRTIDAGDGERIAALLDAGAEAVVMLAVGEAAGAVSDAAASRGALSVSVEVDADGGSPRSTVVLRPRPADERNVAQGEVFAAAYTEEYRTPPTDAALLGYDAGRLVDRLVAEFGETLEPGGGTSEAARALQGQLLAADLVVAAAEAHEREGALAALAGRGTSGLALLAGAVTLLLAGSAGLAVTRRARAG